MRRASRARMAVSRERASRALMAASLRQDSRALMGISLPERSRDLTTVCFLTFRASLRNPAPEEYRMRRHPESTGTVKSMESYFLY